MTNLSRREFVIAVAAATAIAPVALSEVEAHSDAGLDDQKILWINIDSIVRDNRTLYTASVPIDPNLTALENLNARRALIVCQGLAAEDLRDRIEKEGWPSTARLASGFKCDKEGFQIVYSVSVAGKM